MGGILWLAMVVVLWPETVMAGDNLPWEKKLPFENARIEYRISGMEEGKEILYIQDYGKKIATHRETVTKMMGMEMHTSTIEIKTENEIYTFDLLEGSGFKGVNPRKYMIEEFAALTPAQQQRARENAKKLGATFELGVGAEIEPKAVKLHGFACDKVSIMGGAVSYLIHDTEVALKTEVNMMGMKMLTEAVSFEKGGAKAKDFASPEGIPVEEDTDADELSKDMARNAIAILLDPERAKLEQERQEELSEGQDVPSPEEMQEMEQQMEQMMQILRQNQPQ